MRRVSSIGDAEGLFDYEELVCDQCASALRVLALPVTADSIDAIGDLLDAEGRVIHVIPACKLCIAAFQAKHGPPKPL